ncbi:3'(2'), 5'-bisphosphate nucleotidase [Rhizobium sp. PP-CC-2G-626]|nr:3'(2'), 5'-bisphosphate nucleotidase [Rhizobium sp. PP-CC-2G-626]
MSIGKADTSVSFKTDGSIVTDADRAAEETIMAILEHAFPDLTAIGEERASMPGGLPSNITDAYFLVDALDGTTIFAGGGSDFTVNIAYIENGALICGLIYAPKHGELFWGTDQGAFKALRSEAFAVDHQIWVDPRVEVPRIVVSGSRDMDRVNEFVAMTGGVLEHVGASLKYCRIAEGKADVYPCFGPTKEWDTAAGHAILLAAGGTLCLLDGGDLTYGKGDRTTEAGFLNPPFYASSSAQLLEF